MKDKVLRVRLTEKEFNQLKLTCRKLGLTMSQAIRYLLEDIGIQEEYKEKGLKNV